ncbi:IclR family transcriptional regulator [Blastococcus sp. BMG 814]|uniref:IclR family transcriptional regulator n=1 Tax=Blastococcus carthaginiensis TaxID=3050034 RepID=A0ABT9IAD6_9ACTN|nr:IclR family transcriptional regulator [Blastococcus carthaginiensis]MDP5182533.1 IclR family transcriptional regulator [Blastococcus carthaginiensis]
MDADDEGCPKSVLGKAQLLLSAFAAGAYHLRLTELSRRSGVPKASAYRLAQELVQWGLLERVGDGYQLGVKVFELGQRVPIAATLRRVSRPLLADLFATTRTTIHLAVLDGGHVLYIEKVAGEANIHSHSEVGGRLPATCTATGKVLLALSADGESGLQRCHQTGVMRPTSRSAASVMALRGHLAEVRRRGFAVEVEETVVGYASVAVPVMGSDGSAFAAVSATSPASRLAVGRLVPQLQGTAAGIARAVERQVTTESSTADRIPPVASRTTR